MTTTTPDGTTEGTTVLSPVTGTIRWIDEDFGGMSIEETASAIGVSPRTVKRDWMLAQAWLQRVIERVI